MADGVVAEVEKAERRKRADIGHVFDVVAGEVARGGKVGERGNSSSRRCKGDKSGISLILLKERSRTLGMREKQNNNRRFTKWEKCLISWILLSYNSNTSRLTSVSMFCILWIRFERSTKLFVSIEIA